MIEYTKIQRLSDRRAECWPPIPRGKNGFRR